MEGDAKSGFTVFWADDGLDTGPILLQRECSVEISDTVDSLYTRFLFPEGIRAMVCASVGRWGCVRRMWKGKGCVCRCVCVCAGVYVCVDCVCVNCVMCVIVCVCVCVCVCDSVCVIVCV